MTLSWEFSNLMLIPSQEDLTDVVVSVQYRAAYSETGTSKFSYSKGECTFAAPDPDVFTPFGDIDEATMVVFVERALGERLDEIKAELKTAYDSPVVSSDLPWVIKRQEEYDAE